MTPSVAVATQPSFYWVRIKPFNPKRNCKLMRFHVLGRVWTGGDGIWDIPEWVKVNRAQAAECKRYFQSGFTTSQGPNDRKAFDIVTDARKREVDARELEVRMRVRGLGAAAVTELPDLTAPSHDVNAPAKRRMTLEDFEGDGLPEATAAPAPNREHLAPVDDSLEDVDDLSAPDPMLSSGEDDRDALDDVDEVDGVAAVGRVTASEVDVSGRNAAAEGFDAEGTDLNDGQDVDDVAPQYGLNSGDDPIPTPKPMPAPRAGGRRGGGSGGSRSGSRSGR